MVALLVLKSNHGLGEITEMFRRGVHTTIQYRLGDHWVGAARVLFTVAGQNTQNAIFPNFSIYYYWGKGGKVIMQ